MPAVKRVLCRSCDLIVELPPFRQGVDCHCPNCNAVIRRGSRFPLCVVGIVSIASVIMLCTSVFLPFMTVSAVGITHTMSLWSVVTVLRYDWTFLLYVFLLFTFICPLIMHLVVIAIVFMRLRVTVAIASVYSLCHRFSMVDVFVLGVLISLIKLMALADVSFHSGFYCMLLFAILMVWCCRFASPLRIWGFISGTYYLSDPDLKAGDRGISHNLVVCSNCANAYKGDPEDPMHEVRCPRCGHKNAIRKSKGYQKTMALLIAAAVVYVPANIYPIMFTSYLGSSSGANILDGVIALWGMRSYFVAAVILIASICIPVLKIASIIALMYWSVFGFKGKISDLNKLYRVVVFIGRWSMIDVFVVIIMSTVVRMSGMLEIAPGMAIVCFCIVVLLTMIAAEEFDQRLLWDRQRRASDQAFLKNHARLKKVRT